MTSTATAALTGVLILAGSVWIGGFVAIGVVARVATRTLDRGARVAFFRGLGRSYGIVGTAALAVAYACGAALVVGRTWDGRLTAVAVVAAALVAVTAIGVAQARRMTRLRRRAIDRPDDPGLSARVRGGAGRAGILRSMIGLLSLALLALAVAVGS